ncbi:MAG: tryptophan synthase subunit alpha [Nitrososphaerota archaeon]
MLNIREITRKKKCLITYMTLGYPTPDAFMEYCDILKSSGADILELGIPPKIAIYDGTSIRLSYWRVKEQGIDKGMALDIAKNVNATKILLCYLNTAGQLTEFMHSVAETGASSALIPDLGMVGPSALDEYAKACDTVNLEKLFFASYNYPDNTIKIMASYNPVFVYIGISSVTGEVAYIDPAKSITRVRGLVGNTPLVAGFGIRDLSYAKTLVGMVDGIVVGSELVNIIEDNTASVAKKKVSDFVTSLKSVLESVS